MYIRFEGGLLHNQHIFIKPWRDEWHFVVPAKPPNWGALENFHYELRRLQLATGCIFFEYHLTRHYLETRTQRLDPDSADG